MSCRCKMEEVRRKMEEGCMEVFGYRKLIAYQKAKEVVKRNSTL